MNDSRLAPLGGEQNVAQAPRKGQVRREKPPKPAQFSAPKKPQFEGSWIGLECAMRAVANGVWFGLMAVSGHRSPELVQYLRNRKRVAARRKKKKPVTEAT